MGERRIGLLDSSFASAARAFAVELLAFARPRLLGTASLVLLGAVLEGFGLLLIVPLLAMVTSEGAPSGAPERGASTIFASLDINDPTARLALLLSVFALLIVLRGIVIAKRDLRLAEWQFDFVETLRLRIIETLAAAPWERITRLRHARVIHLMSGDIVRIGTAAQLVLRTTVSTVMLLAQAVLVFLLAPALAAVAATRNSGTAKRHAAAADDRLRSESLALCDRVLRFADGRCLAQ
jgi:ATP-binding cassette, subfamily C, bacterial